MQNNTVDYVNKRHPSSTVEAVAEKVSSIAEGVKEAAVEAKDTIMGPLATAGKKLTGSDSGDATGDKGKKK